MLVPEYGLHVFLPALPSWTRESRISRQITYRYVFPTVFFIWFHVFFAKPLVRLVRSNFSTVVACLLFTRASTKLLSARCRQQRQEFAAFVRAATEMRHRLGLRRAGWFTSQKPHQVKSHPNDERTFAQQSFVFPRLPFALDPMHLSLYIWKATNHFYRAVSRCPSSCKSSFFSLLPRNISQYSRGPCFSSIKCARKRQVRATPLTASNNSNKTTNTPQQNDDDDM